MRDYAMITLIALGLAGCNRATEPAPVRTTTTPAATTHSNQTTTSPTTGPAMTGPAMTGPTTTTSAKENTAENIRDRDSAAKTPIDQKENKSDIKITADIRKRVVATEMSLDAHNVKIITADGKVTLRGPVKTAEEKKQIEEIAHEVAGADNVDSQLEVAE